MGDIAVSKDYWGGNQELRFNLRQLTRLGAKVASQIDQCVLDLLPWPGRLDLRGGKGNQRPVAEAGADGVPGVPPACLSTRLPLGGAVCPGGGSRVRSLTNLL